MSGGADTAAAEPRSRLKRTAVVDAPEICGGRTAATLEREESEVVDLERVYHAGKKMSGDSDCGSEGSVFTNLGVMDMSKVIATCVFPDSIFADKPSGKG